MDDDLDCTDARLIHEMRFADFANTIMPMSGICVARGDVTPRDDMAWVRTLWSTADRRLTYFVAWQHGALKQALPPSTLEHEFEDKELRAPALALGLDPESQEDLEKAAELLAIQTAWLKAVKWHWQRLTSDKRNERFDSGVADDFVRLTCRWTEHPWVQRQVREYRAEQAVRLARRPAIAPVFSSDPRWPNTAVIIGKIGQPHPEAEYLAKMESIGYWLNKLDTENRAWSSAFAIDAWDAAGDIVLANSKIATLQGLLDAQRAHVQNLEQVVKQNKRRDAELSRNHGKPGRPQVPHERQAIARQFTATWVRSLMAALEVDACAHLEEMVSHSSQRNWRRWLSGHAVPTQSSLTELQSSKVVLGRNRGLRLKDIVTTPKYDELLRLVHLVSLSRGRLPDSRPD